MKTFSQGFSSLKTAALRGLLAVAILMASPLPATARQVLNGIKADPESGIDIEVSSDFDNLRSSGAASFHVRIQNNTSYAGTWRFRMDGSGYEPGIHFEQELRVEPGQTRTFPLVAPLHNHGSRFPAFVAVTGPGMPDRRAPISRTNPNPAIPSTQALAMSPDLSARSWESLRKFVEVRKRSFEAVRFDADSLPSSWRGYAGLEWLALSQTEWSGLAPEVRSAIRQWVGFGGHLVIASQNPSAASSDEFRLGPGGGPANYGFGNVRTLAWDGKEVPAAVLGPLVMDGASLVEAGNRKESLDWPPLAALGKWTPPGALVLTLVIALAVAIGPVNLFYLAPAGRRHRLFFTTPLLSLGGSALLLLTILLRDGTGGKGNRFTLVHLLPGANEAVVLQDQVSRTGLLLSSGFSVGEEALVYPVQIDKFPTKAMQFSIAGRDYSQNWFRSRTIQIQHLATLRSTRAALTQLGLDPSGAPLVVSSFENPLAKVVMRDQEGKLWQADNLATGEKAALTPANETESLGWWRESTEGARGETRALLFDWRWNEAPFEKGHFYAVAAAPGHQPIETLRSIRWRESQVAAMGPVTRPAPAAKGETP